VQQKRTERARSEHCEQRYAAEISVCSGKTVTAKRANPRKNQTQKDAPVNVFDVGHVGRVSPPRQGQLHHSCVPAFPEPARRNTQSQIEIAY
jgi:acetylglutamate kinase